MAVLRTEGVSVSFGAGAHRVRPLRDVDVQFVTGEMALVRGPSGSGKSTLLAVLGGLLQADAGCVCLDALCVSDLGDSARARFRMRQVGFVFQSFQLFDTMSARENVALPLLMAGVGRARSMERAEALLDTFGLAGRAGAMPRELSGGEQQRVAVARALSLDPVVLLADEPTASLDGDAGRTVSSLLQRAAHEFGKLVVTISHDERLLPYADRVVTLADGRVVSDRKPS